MTAKLHTPTTTDLVRFLITRIDEDDTELRARRRRRSRAGEPVVEDGGVGSLDRLLDECRARRDVVGHVQHLLVLRDQPQEKAVRDQAVKLLRALAAPYRDHPGFWAEWAT